MQTMCNQMRVIQIKTTMMWNKMTDANAGTSGTLEMQRRWLSQLQTDLLPEAVAKTDSWHLKL
jgi:hypothetical protein